MVDNMLAGVVIALFVLALALRLYPWRDTRKRQHARLAASVAWGAFFGLLALSFFSHIWHNLSHALPVSVAIAVLFPVAAMMTARRQK